MLKLLLSFLFSLLLLLPSYACFADNDDEVLLKKRMNYFAPKALSPP